jgi:hypothetical protein
VSGRNDRTSGARVRTRADHVWKGSPRMAETAEEIKARKERERDELYALDISGVE